MGDYTADGETETGTPRPLLIGDPARDLQVSQFRPSGFAETIAGRRFSAHNQSAQAFSVALTTTYTGLVLSCPIGSGVNLILTGAGLALSVAPAAIASAHLIGTWSPSVDTVHTTPVTPRCNILGAAAPVGKVDLAATIVTPFYLEPLMSGFTAAALPSSPMVGRDINGRWIITPGGAIAIGVLTAVTGFGWLEWIEVPA